MVSEEITNGERIATVLRAEIEGRKTGGLDRLSIDEADYLTVLADGHPLAVLDPLETGLAIRFRPAEPVRETLATDQVTSLLGQENGLSPDFQPTEQPQSNDSPADEPSTESARNDGFLDRFATGPSILVTAAAATKAATDLLVTIAITMAE